MARTHRVGAILVAGGLLMSGCYGPFNLTRQLHTWNGQVGDKYVNELVFLAFTVMPLPIYGVAVLADMLIFNAIEFWTGRNPVFLSLRSTPVQTARLLRQASQPQPNPRE